MTIPDYQAIMLPFLKFAGDKQEHLLQDAVENLAAYCKLTEEELHELLPSGQQAVFRNHIGWARSYMKQSFLLKSTERRYLAYNLFRLFTINTLYKSRHKHQVQPIGWRLYQIAGKIVYHSNHIFLKVHRRFCNIFNDKSENVA